MHQVICISRGTLSGGKELAERLAAKLGYACISREDLMEPAIKAGIQIGKLEVAMMKQRGFSDRLALERDAYLAFSTAFLCDRAVERPVVYHGRTGHLLLPGVRHVLRVRVVADREYRLRVVMEKLGIDRDKARRYLDDVDEDRNRWVRAMYGKSWEDVGHYDFVVNLQHLNVDNAATALTAMAQLPDFQMTPASKRAMDNLRVGARARLLLAKDDRTWRSSFKVRATDGAVNVTFQPRDAHLVSDIGRVLSAAPGIVEVHTTVASTNILWIQETFDTASTAFRNVVEIASKWGAAVELLRLKSDERADGNAVQSPLAVESAPPAERRRDASDGGIEDDTGEQSDGNDGGVTRTLEELAKLGMSGGSHIACGGNDCVLGAVDRSVPYSMLVVGDVYLSKPAAARTRMARELRGFLADHFRTAVVACEELELHYLFRARDLVRMLVFLLLVTAVVISLFMNQRPVLELLAAPGWKARVIATILVTAFAPLLAYLYGTVVKSFLKWIRME
jgi:cytidylate kinase